MRDSLDHFRAMPSPRSLVLRFPLITAPPPLRGQAAIPNTPAGSALRAWLDAYNSGDSARVAAFLCTYQVDFPIRNSFHFRQMTGGWDGGSGEGSEPRPGEAFLRPRHDVRLTAHGLRDVAAGSPTKISGNAFPLGPNVPTEAL